VALGQIRISALEDQTPTAQGSSITFTVTPIGSSATNRVDVLDITAEGLIPGADDAYTLGSEDFRWNSIYLGPGTIYIQDTADEDLIAELRVTNGVLTIDGANQLQVGQLKFIDNTIESETPDIDIQIGTTDATANLVLNRNVSIGAGKTLSAGNVYVSGSIIGNTTGIHTGAVVGDVTGTATTATNLAAATSILAGTLTIDPANINKTSSSTQTFTLTGLTTNHKIVITSGTALTYGVTIVSAWASATDTLSINFHNYSGGGVNLGSTSIQYFAWV
jgi:hypothetical protein